MTRKINAETEALIKRYEELRLVAYDDKQPKKVLSPGDKIVGTLTIGWGHTGPDVFIGQKITQEQAQAFFDKDVAEVADAVMDHVEVTLNDNQFGALVSWAFNVGEGWLEKASFVKQLNKGDFSAPITGLPQFRLSGGVVMKGLVARRAAEVALWAKSYGGTIIGEPVPTPHLAKTKTVIGAALAGTGGLGQTIIETVQPALPMAEGFPWLKVGFAVLIAAGVALTIYGRYQTRQTTGA
ncbi:lysozyme [Inquilinus limosus]|uniref:lysozyme n=1 Tax=Inquilinus limosus TaxID=171674 RepID=UPI0006910D92|nr:lysozyme [Inquilinus limosus]